MQMISNSSNLGNYKAGNNKQYCEYLETNNSHPFFQAQADRHRHATNKAKLSEDIISVDNQIN